MLTHKGKKKARLRNARVTHISLVDRPANKRRFAVIKSEQGGRDVTLRNILKMGPKPPRVVAAFGTDRAFVQKAANDFAIKGDVKEPTEGMFSIGAAEGDEVIGISTGEDSGYVLERATKSLTGYNMEALSFDEVLKHEGFMPSLHMALSALAATVHNAAAAEDIKTPEQFSDVVAKATGEFAGYVSALVSSLPETAFKYEREMLATKAADAPESNGDADGGDEDPVPARKAEEPSEAAESDQEAPKVEDPAEETPAEEDQMAVLIAKMTEQMTGVLKGALAEHAEAVKADVDRLQEGVEKLTKDVEAATSRTTAVEKALKGTVNSTPEPAPIPAKKANGSAYAGEPPLIDTAYMSIQ